MKKKLSFLLSLILIFNVFCSSITPVYAASSSTTQANFINFYAKGDEVVLDMANLTTNDYYAMFAYMSNWFEPGKTTLADVVNASKDTAFYKNFVAAIQKSDSEKLLDIVHSFGSDVMTGINSGKCILLDSGGEIVNGKIFLTAILNSVDNSDVDLGRGEKEESFS